MEKISVPTPKRNEAPTEFIYNARELYKYTIQKCKRNSKAKKDERYENIIPTCYYDLVGKKLVDRADLILMHVQAGNRIYPLNQEEVQIRRNHFVSALGYADNFDTLLQSAYEVIHFDRKTYETWSRLISSEIGMLVSAIKSDRRRYKNIK